MTEMIFEGRTEREAVKLAAEKLGSESFDVEIIEKSGGLFSKSKVKIRVKPLSYIPAPVASPTLVASVEKEDSQTAPPDPPSEDIIRKTAEYTEGILNRMGYSGTVRFKEFDGAKVMLVITSEHSNIIIGRRGKNLDALQILSNTYFIRLVGNIGYWRIVIDMENYRVRQKESISRTAHRAADTALRTGSVQVLGLMNPFERRIVHATISSYRELTTKSDGDGLYKRVKIIPQGTSRNHSRKRR